MTATRVSRKSAKAETVSGKNGAVAKCDFGDEALKNDLKKLLRNADLTFLDNFLLTSFLGFLRLHPLLANRKIIHTCTDI